MGATQLSPYYFGLYDTQTGVKIGEPPLPGRGRSRAFCIKRIIPQTDNITNNASSPQPISLLPPSTAFSSPPTRKINLARPQKKTRRATPTKITISGLIRPPTAVIRSLIPVILNYLLIIWVKAAGQTAGQNRNPDIRKPESPSVTTE